MKRHKASLEMQAEAWHLFWPVLVELGVNEKVPEGTGLEAAIEFVRGLAAENAKLRQACEGLKTERDRIWEGCLEFKIMRDVALKALGEASPEAEKEAWIEINRRINAMNAKAREAAKTAAPATAGEGGGA